MTTLNRLFNTERGFTLIEIAIVLVVLALLIGGLLTPLTTQIQIRKIEQTKETMEEIKQSLIGFAIQNLSLPCPDTTGDGIVDPCVSIAANATNAGWLPWVTLGVSQADAWGNRYRYQVTGQFTSPNITPPPGCDPGLDLCDTGTMVITTRDANKGAIPMAGTLPANGIPVVLLSYGPNGYGATTNAGGTIPKPPALVNIDELANTGGAVGLFNAPVLNIMSRPMTGVSRSTDCHDTAAAPPPMCEFDDIVTWIPATTLFKSMVDAGTLP